MAKALGKLIAGKVFIGPKVREGITEQLLKGFTIQNKGLVLTHLQYPNNTLLSCDAWLEKLRIRNAFQDVLKLS